MTGLALAIMVESVALHFVLRPHSVPLAWSLTALSAASLLCIALDYRAMGRGGVVVTDDAVELRIGFRHSAVFPRGQVRQCERMSWRDIPAHNARAGYMNLSSPADANVLLVLSPPIRLAMLGGWMHRDATRLALHVDDVDALLQDLRGDGGQAPLRR